MCKQMSYKGATFPRNFCKSRFRSKDLSASKINRLNKFVNTPYSMSAGSFYLLQMIPSAYLYGRSRGMVLCNGQLAIARPSLRRSLTGSGVLPGSGVIRLIFSSDFSILNSTTNARKLFHFCRLGLNVFSPISILQFAANEGLISAQNGILMDIMRGHGPGSNGQAIRLPAVHLNEHRGFLSWPCH
jgi:hypothetical protein